MTLTVGSLFSGIGGLDLGLERAGMRVIWQSEIDNYASRVLAKHWKDTPNHGDIKEIDWSQVERPDVICGGYPCQPFSTAGKRRGEEDPRHLWPWVREAISQLRPSYAILENVRGHLSLGGTTVIGELASIGYDAEWRVVSAASVGAPHRRDRIVIVAYPNDTGSGTPECGFDTNRAQVEQKRQDKPQCRVSGCCVDVAYPNGERLERQRPELQTTGTTRSSENSGQSMANTNNQRWESRPRQSQPQSDRRSANEAEHWGSNTVDSGVSEAENVADNECERDGEHRFTADTATPGRSRVYYRGGQEGYVGWEWWQTEPDVGRVANGVPNRVDRLKGLGNAVVPQVAEVIGRLVVAHHERISK